MLYYILFNTSLTPEQAVILFLISLFSFMFSLTIHEFAHGLVAYKMGDDTPKLSGRLTIDPFKHLDLKGFILFMLLGVGWAKPIPVNPTKFKKYRTGIRLVSISGVLANLTIGLISAGLYALLGATVPNGSVAGIEYVYLTLQYLMLINSFLAMFNILPIHPLDGFNFITSFMKSNNKFIYNGIKNGFKILIGILLGSLLIEIMFNVDILGFYLSLLYDWFFVPIASLGV